MFETNLIKLLQIYKTQLTLFRCGADSDGTYVLPKEMIEKSKKLISCGIANNIDFEKCFHAINNKAEIECYDGSIDFLPENDIENIEFYKKFIGKYSNDNEICLNDIINHEDTVLKMDIEGAEYGSFESFDDNKFKLLNCIVIEFHCDYQGIATDKAFPYFINTLNKILKFFTIVHIHPNNYSTYIKYQDYNIPQYLEITFVNNNFITKKELITKYEDLNTELDICNVYKDKQLLMDWIEK